MKCANQITTITTEISDTLYSTTARQSYQLTMTVKRIILVVSIDPLQICLNVSSGWKTFWDEISMTPYAVQGSKVITYDDERSIAEKVNVYTADIALETVLRFGVNYFYNQFS
jgi:GH18 family chitinase